VEKKGPVYIEEENKQYYEGLEIENKELNKKIVELEDLISKLEKSQQEEKKDTINNIIAQKLSKSAFSPVKYPELSTLLKLKTSEQFIYGELSNLIKNNPTKIKESEVKALDETVGINGTERITFIKAQFRNIIDNVLPFESQLSLILFDQIPLSKLIRLMSGSKNKFMKRK